MASLEFPEQRKESQRAYHRTIVLFPFAVMAVLLATSVLLAGFSAATMVARDQMLFPNETILSFGEYFHDFITNPGFLGIVWAITLLAIVVSAWAKILEISRSDSIGTKINDQTCWFLSDFKEEEKTLFRLVEKTAQAVRVATPEVFLLERESSINAFLTQAKQKKAALFVTAGCLKRLDSEELQAVIAHELSHFVNNSLKNEARTVGLLSGLSIVYELGQDIVSPYRDSLLLFSLGKSKNVTISPYMGRRILTVCFLAGVYLVMGLSLMIIGSIGILAARVIKRIAYRRRAILADAAAIQFTHNTALSRVLLKIAISNKKPDRRIQCFNAESISHLCFADPYGRRKRSFFSAHPSLKKRSQALNGAAAPTEH